MSGLDAGEVGRITTSERRRFADWLDQLDPGHWQQQSMCRDWTVRDVVGHMTFPWRVPTLKLLGQMARHRGFDRASSVGAHGLAKLGPSELVQQIRDHAEDHRRPPGTVPEDLLAEIVLHPLDIAMAVGEPWEADPAAVAHLLDHVTSHKKGTHYQPPGGIDGLRWVATDTG